MLVSTPNLKSPQLNNLMETRATIPYNICHYADKDGRQVISFEFFLLFELISGDVDTRPFNCLVLSILFRFEDAFLRAQ